MPKAKKVKLPALLPQERQVEYRYRDKDMESMSVTVLSYGPPGVDHKRCVLVNGAAMA